MTTPTVKRGGNKEKDVRDIWECRYFVSELPQRFKHKELNKFFDESYHPIIENDLYFITDDNEVDIKLRKIKEPRPTIKVKKLQYTRGEFELWRTTINDKLPAPVDVWSEVLAQLKVEGDIDLLSSYSKPNQVKKVLCDARPAIQCRETQKRRRRYIRSQVEVEVAEVTIGSSFLYSVSFESKSTSPSQVRVIRDELSVYDLGPPKNYMRLLSEISPG